MTNNHVPPVSTAGSDRKERSQLRHESPDAPAGFIVVAVALLLGILAAHWRKIDSSELLFHAKIGELIYSSGEIPNRDIFSVGTHTDIWVYFEWLWGWILAFTIRLGQWTALNGLSVGLASATYGLVVLRSRRWLSGWLESIAVAVLIGTGLLPVYQPEPGIAALLLFIATLLLMEGRRGWPMAVFPLVVALWVNVHAGVLIAFAMPMARIIYPDDERSVNRVPRSFIAVMMVVGAVAILMNPNSVRAIDAFGEIAASQLLGAPGRLASVFDDASVVLRVALAAAFAFVAIAGRSLSRREIFVSGILVAAFLALGTSSVNFLLLYIAAPAALGLTRLRNRIGAVNTIRYLSGTAVLVACVAWAALVLFAVRLTPDAWGAGIRPGVFPETAAGRLAAIPLRAAILNRSDDGGYLVWRLWPNWKVCADRRPGIYSPESLTQYEKIWRGGEGWQSYIALWRVHAILGDTEILERFPSHNLYVDLANSDDWTPVYWDRNSILYVKSDIELRSTNLVPFRQLKPGLPWRAMEARIDSPREWRELAADIRRALLDDPGNVVAQEFLRRAEREI